MHYDFIHPYSCAPSLHPSLPLTPLHLFLSLDLCQCLECLRRGEERRGSIWAVPCLRLLSELMVAHVCLINEALVVFSFLGICFYFLFFEEIAITDLEKQKQQDKHQEACYHLGRKLMDTVVAREQMQTEAMLSLSMYPSRFPAQYEKSALALSNPCSLYFSNKNQTLTSLQ